MIIFTSYIHEPIKIDSGSIEMTIILFSMLHAHYLFNQFIYFLLAWAMDTNQLFVLGKGHGYGCGTIIFLLDHIKMLIIIKTHVPHTLSR